MQESASRLSGAQWQRRHALAFIKSERGRGGKSRENDAQGVSIFKSIHSRYVEKEQKTSEKKSTQTV